jgi:hypothetical protein
MRVSREEFLIERIFSPHGDALGSLSVKEAYAELQELSGCDFGMQEQEWRRWLRAWKRRITDQLDIEETDYP